MIWGKTQKLAVAATSSEALALRANPPEKTVTRRGENGSDFGGKWVGRVTLKDLPGLLLTHDMVTPEQMQSALAQQSGTGDYLGDILIDEHIIEEDAFVAFLAKYYRIPHLCLQEYPLDESLFSLATRDFCLRHRVVPIDRLGKNLTLAMVNPFDNEALIAIHQRCPNLQIRTILCTRCHFEAVAAQILERRHRCTELCGPLRRSTDDGDCKTERSTRVHLPEGGFQADQPMSMPSVERLAQQNPAAPAPRLALSAAPAKAGTDHALPATPPAPLIFLNSLCELQNSPEPDYTVWKPRPASPPNRSIRSDTARREVTTMMVSAMKSTFNALLRRVTLFRGLDPESVAQIFARARMVECETGEFICRQGEDSRCVYAVLSGTVEIRDDWGRLDHAHPGEIFGEAALINSTAANASACATEPSCLLQLTLEDITQNLPAETVVRLMLNITVTLNRRLRNAQAAQPR